ncbi:MAG: excinuclease ABC subunit UvrB [Patescibacteria group bacterium]|nr:excinuclease ABC subunit UvrB [Patescibacteria group bacterium]
MEFKLHSSFRPTGDQPSAIEKLTKGIGSGLKNQVLLGVTGSGKTYTMANIIKRLQRPALIISHNKTLAAQLYQEFRDFFPENAVSYFVSYYDFYQPEAYIPQSDTYIEKETEINEEIDKLRLAATTNLLTRRDTIIVASVSCIYNIGSPAQYRNFVLKLAVGMKIDRKSLYDNLVDLQYEKSNFDFKRGTFRTRGDNIDIYPAYEDTAVRITASGDIIDTISVIDALNGKMISSKKEEFIYPAKHYITDTHKYTDIFAQIRDELDKRVNELKKHNKIIEAYRLAKRVNFDLEMINEVGYINGIENYSRYFDGRKAGDPPYSLLDYFSEPYGKDWLLFIDESHMTLPQIRGMYNGDRSRKQTLIDFGFRLPSALDNRPLTYEEFYRRISQAVYVSATPNEYELSLAREDAKSHNFTPQEGITEQLIRPTGICDPQIIIRPTNGQIKDLVKEILSRKQRKERVLVTTLTKRMAEDLSSYLQDKSYIDKLLGGSISSDLLPNVHYLHSDIQTLERSDILDELRSGKYDVLVGINLLREGLDLPEVSLVAILDADKEGFLRSDTSLVQTMGRAARHIAGTVIMYADNKTGSMARAISEIDRRRQVQFDYNKRYNITPRNVEKPIREKLIEKEELDETLELVRSLDSRKRMQYRELMNMDFDDLTPRDRTKLIRKMETEMKQAAGELNFELAAEIRDKIKEYKYDSKDSG